MRKLRCIIVDDEPLAARLLASYAKRCDNLELVGSYTSSSEALEILENNNIDIAFLDIQMPQMNGLDIARVLDGKTTAVIFVTAFRNYAFEGFKVHAIDYLLKPVSFEEFSASVERATGLLQESPNEERTPRFLTVRSDYRLIKIDLENILYIEGLKDYVKIYTANTPRPILTLMSMKSIEQTLPENEFMRIHRSYIVSVNHIKSFDRSHVQIVNTTIPIGSTYRTRMTNLFNTKKI